MIKFLQQEVFQKTLM